MFSHHRQRGTQHPVGSRLLYRARVRHRSAKGALCNKLQRQRNPNAARDQTVILVHGVTRSNVHERDRSICDHRALDERKYRQNGRVPLAFAGSTSLLCKNAGPQGIYTTIPSVSQHIHHARIIKLDRMFALPRCRSVAVTVAVGLGYK